MSESEDLEILERDGYLEARYLGTYALHSYVIRMERSVRACEERGLTRLLVDITGLRTYRPTTAERHKIGVTGASLSQRLSKVAALVTAEQVERDTATVPPESEPFATTVARNRGLEIRTFLVPAEAVDWLLKP